MAMIKRLSTLLVLVIAYVYLYVSHFRSNQEAVYVFRNEKLNHIINGKSIPDSKQEYHYDPMKTGHQKLSGNSYLMNPFPHLDKNQIGTENATMVMLVRNSELEGALQSMRSLEDRFNRHYKYPYVFLNEVPFSDEFKERTSLMASGETYYELIPEKDWLPPPHIDEDKLNQNIEKSQDIIYGWSKSYRNMCHFNSGFFYKQKILDNYDYYFRIEPDVEYMCDFQYDPFTFLRENNKDYGFVIAIHEYENTIPTLWETVKNFTKDYPDLIHPNNSLDFITTKEVDINYGFNISDNDSEYNLCHFWSNFEIGNLNFFRSDAYNTYFNYLDQAGGFFYERWGDAPVHSIGLNLLMDKNRIHHFEDIGYYHVPYLACPTSIDVKTSKRCFCKTRGLDHDVLTTPIDAEPFSCLARWWRYGSGKKFLNEIDYTFSH